MRWHEGTSCRKGEPYRCCFAPLDHTFCKDADLLPLLYERS